MGYPIVVKRFAAALAGEVAAVALVDSFLTLECVFSGYVRCAVGRQIGDRLTEKCRLQLQATGKQN